MAGIRLEITDHACLELGCAFPSRGERATWTRHLSGAAALGFDGKT